MKSEKYDPTIQQIAARVVSRFGYAGRVTDTKQHDDGTLTVTVQHRTLEGPERTVEVLCDASGMEIERH